MKTENKTFFKKERFNERKRPLGTADIVDLAVKAKAKAIFSDLEKELYVYWYDGRMMRITEKDFKALKKKHGVDD